MVVVTGGAGFIGSVFVWKLNIKGIDKILIVDSFRDSATQEKWRNLIGLKFYDIIDKSDFFDIARDIKPEAVFHFGAKTSTTERNFHLLLKENYEFSKKIFLWSVERGARFVYASSAATYGDGRFGFSDDEENIYKLRPLNAYAFSKHLFDLWLLKNRYIKNALGLKFFNVFGPNEYHKGDMRSFVVKAFEQIKSTGKVRLFKSYHPEIQDGEQKRDFIYVKDAVDVVFFLFEKGKTGIYNVGTGKAHSFNELVKAVFSALSMPPKIEYFDMPEDLKNQYQYFTQADISKLEKAGYDLGKLTNFEDKVREYVREYLSQGMKVIGENTSY